MDRRPDRWTDRDAFPPLLTEVLLSPIVGAAEGSVPVSSASSYTGVTLWQMAMALTASTTRVSTLRRIVTFLVGG